MKKTLLLAAGFFAFVFNVSAQSIPNGDFETWYSTSYEIPENYVQSSNTDVFFRCQTPFNCVKTTDSYSGTYAVQLTTELGNNDTCFGYFINGNPNNEDPSNWHGGIPYTEMPTGLKGYYKSAIPAGDSAGVIVIFSKAGIQIGQYIMKLYGTNASYVPFTLNFTPALSMAPDSVMFGVTSSDVFNGIAIAGSTITIDSVTFTGGVTQPALMNGSFETWNTIPIDIPTGWFVNSSQGEGFTKTTDSYAGTYAAELTTYEGDRNGNPTAQAGNLSTGYYFCNGGPCYLYGGLPYTNQIDTLTFYYNYAPMADDSAQVDMQFKAGGNQFSWQGKLLEGTGGTYQYVEIPFNLGSVPDSVVISILSSTWKDSALVYIGSVLKIDQLQFKSQPLPSGITDFSNNKDVSVYPNPSTGMVYIQSDSKISELEITNVIGEKVYSAEIGNYKTAVDFSRQPKGVYFYKLKNSDKIISKGKLIIQ
jgi:hypothetical protein